MLWQAPLVLILAIANPLFVSAGSTELFRIGLHAVYLEALCYGLCQGLMLVNVLLAFSIAARVVSSDKVLCVLGNATPTLAFMISITMRLVPQFVRRGKAIADTQKAHRRRGLRRIQVLSAHRRLRSLVQLYPVCAAGGAADDSRSERKANMASINAQTGRVRQSLRVPAALCQSESGSSEKNCISGSDRGEVVRIRLPAIGRFLPSRARSARSIGRVPQGAFQLLVGATGSGKNHAFAQLQVPRSPRMANALGELAVFGQPFRKPAR